jgi:hypothetical protein
MQSAKQSHRSSRACSTDLWSVNPLSSRPCTRSDERLTSLPSGNPSCAASSHWIPPSPSKKQSGHFCSPEGGDRQTHDVKCSPWQWVFCFTGFGVVEAIGDWVVLIQSRFVLLFHIIIAGKNFFIMFQSWGDRFGDNGSDSQLWIAHFNLVSEQLSNPENKSSNLDLVFIQSHQDSRLLFYLDHKRSKSLGHFGKGIWQSIEKVPLLRLPLRESPFIQADPMYRDRG